MTQTVTAVEARQKLGEMLNRVILKQEEIIIERAGKKVAKLTSVEQEVSHPQGRLDFRKAAGLGKEIWQKTDVAAYLKQEREEWE